jgi:cell division protein FtsL
MLLRKEKDETVKKNLLSGYDMITNPEKMNMTLLIVPIFLSTHYISAVIHVYKLQYTTNLLSHSVNKSTALFSVVLKPVLVSTTSTLSFI